MCKNQELNPHIIIHPCIWSQFLWFQLGGVAFFLSFWHTIQIYNRQSFYNHSRKQILRNVCTKTFYANALYFFPFFFACAFLLISLVNMVGELCSCFCILICVTQARVSWILGLLGICCMGRLNWLPGYQDRKNLPILFGYTAKSF